MTASGEFRAHLRAVLASAGIQAELARLRAEPGESDERALYRLLGAAGLLAVSWPRAYGGQDRTATDSLVVVEELMRHGVPDMLYVNSVQTVGQFILAAGNEEQKARFLPPLADGSLFASVLYTEPAVGSDLSALTTTATAVLGGFRVRGTKTFSLKSRFTDIGLCAARTAPGSSKYDGISLLVVDLHAEGVSVRPLDSIADELFHEIVLDDVFVGDNEVIGGLGEGWALLTEALPLERTGLDYAMRAERWLAALVPAIETSDERAGRFGARAQAARLLAWEAATAVANGHPDPTLTATAKWYTSELATDVAEWAAAEGMLTDPLLDSAYREAPGLTLSGGTSEMMLHILSGAVLASGAEDLPVTAEGIEADISAALRAELRPDLSPAAVHQRLGGLGLFGLEVPATAGGLELGLGAGVAVCTELGRATADDGYRACALLADVLRHTGPRGLLADLPGGDVHASVVHCGRSDTAPEHTGWQVLVTPDARFGVAAAATTPEFADVPRALARARVRQAAYLLGNARGAHALAAARAGTRIQFGEPLGAFQAVSFPLAAQYAEMAAVRLLITAAVAADGGPDLPLTAARALASAIEVAFAVTRHAMHVHGAHGMTRAARVHRHYLAVAAEASRWGSATQLWREAATYQRDAARPAVAS